MYFLSPFKKIFIINGKIVLNYSLIVKFCLLIINVGEFRP